MLLVFLFLLGGYGCSSISFFPVRTQHLTLPPSLPSSLSPLSTSSQCGYFEDRRPSSNMDPYVVTGMLIETCCL